MSHPAFDLRNPNRVRAVLGSFAQRNFAAFHAADGSGYRFAAEWIEKLDPMNSFSAAMLVNAFRVCRKLAEPQAGMARNILEALKAKPHSPEVGELLEKLCA
jgi:aminopeptidase N